MFFPLLYIIIFQIYIRLHCPYNDLIEDRTRLASIEENTNGLGNALAAITNTLKSINSRLPPIGQSESPSLMTDHQM